MGLFEDVVVNARTAANVVGKKASQIVDVSKLRISAADLNNDISKRFEAIGRKVYDAEKAGKDPMESMEESVSGIDELYEQLEAVNEQIAAARARQVCRNCGEENAQGAAYCSKCGHKLSED
jgi:hypothetical protein